MKYILVGGAGFIGQELAFNLVEKEHDITIIDTFEYDQRDGFHSEIKVIKDSVENIKRYSDLLREADYVFYMASPRLNEINDLPQPLPHLQGLKETLEICDDYNLKTQVIFFSSCSVYGYQKGTVNELSPTKVTSLYSKLKIDSENLLKSFDNDRFKIIRLSTLYGNSCVSRNDLLVNNFVKDILFSEFLEVYDPGAWRPNIFLDDLIKVLIYLSENNKFEDVLNIGYNELNITKQDLILTLVTQNKLNFAVKYYTPSDSRSYRVNFSKLGNICNIPYTPYSEGIESLIKNLKQKI